MEFLLGQSFGSFWTFLLNFSEVEGILDYDKSLLGKTKLMMLVS